MTSALPEDSQTAPIAKSSGVRPRPWATHIAVPLREIEVSGTRLWEPAAKERTRTLGVTRQFLEDAGQYHERYTSHGHFRVLIEEALARCGVRSVSSVLDLGAGSGNSVIPSLELFPQAHIVAVDISPQLLAILRNHLDRNLHDSERVLTVCADAASDIYVPASFDLCIGAAILHHVMDPQEVVSSVMRALKAEGHAFFFEPFEGGHALLRLAYRRILHSRRAPFLGEAVRVLLAKMVLDYDVRMDTR